MQGGESAFVRLGQHLVQLGRQRPIDLESTAGQLDGRQHQRAPRELAEPLVRQLAADGEITWSPSRQYDTGVTPTVSFADGSAEETVTFTALTDATRDFTIGLANIPANLRAGDVAGALLGLFVSGIDASDLSTPATSWPTRTTPGSSATRSSAWRCACSIGRWRRNTSMRR